MAGGGSLYSTVPYRGDSSWDWESQNNEIPCLGSRVGVGVVQRGPMYYGQWSHGTAPSMDRQTQLKTLPSNDFVGGMITNKIFVFEPGAQVISIFN